MALRVRATHRERRPDHRRRGPRRQRRRRRREGTQPQLASCRGIRSPGSRRTHPCSPRLRPASIDRMPRPGSVVARATPTSNQLPCSTRAHHRRTNQPRYAAEPALRIRKRFESAVATLSGPWRSFDLPAGGSRCQVRASDTTRSRGAEGIREVPNAARRERPRSREITRGQEHVIAIREPARLRPSCAA